MQISSDNYVDREGSSKLGIEKMKWKKCGKEDIIAQK